MSELYTLIDKAVKLCESDIFELTKQLDEKRTILQQLRSINHARYEILPNIGTTVRCVSILHYPKITMEPNSTYTVESINYPIIALSNKRERRVIEITIDTFLKHFTWGDKYGGQRD